MSEEGEYELNALCEKLTDVLTKNSGLTDTQFVVKKFSPVIRKVKNHGYLIFDSYISDVKTIFTNLKKNDSPSPDLENIEKKFAEELNNLISMDYFNSENDSDTSTSDSTVTQSKDSKISKYKCSSKSATVKNKKRQSSGTPAKIKSSPSVVKSPAEEKKIKTKLMPNKRNTLIKTDFDYDASNNKIKTLCTSLLKVANVRSSVQKAFTQLPSRTILPDYYDIIQFPISLSIIKDNIMKGMYTSISHCYSDLIIMCINAKTYNEPHTEIYDMALEVISAISDYMKSLPNSSCSIKTAIKPEYILFDYDSSSPTTSVISEEVFIALWDLFCQVVSRCNKNGRPLSAAFLCLPDKQTYKDYYDEIKEPISLCGIRSKIICAEYENLPNLIEDLSKMCDNAIHFNTKSSIISKDSVNLKDFVRLTTEKFHKFEIKNESDSSPGNKQVKVGEKRKLTSNTKSKNVSKGFKSYERLSPIVKKERLCKSQEVESPKSSRVEHHSVEENVFSCFSDLKEKGNEIQTEMVRMCSAFHKNIDNIVDLEDVLETTENCRNVLLKIVCAMSSRIDSFCPEFSTLESVIGRLIDSDKDYQNLLQCVPVYSFNGNKYFLQEELMVIFRQTPYRNILTQSSSLMRVTKNRKDIENFVSNLDVLSDDILFLDCSDVTRTLQVPLFDKIKNSLPQNSDIIKTPTKLSTDKKISRHEDVRKSQNPVSIKSDINKPKIPKLKEEKTPKPGIKKLQKNTPDHIDSISIDTSDNNLVLKNEKDIEQALSLLKLLKIKKDSEGKLLFKHFMEIPTSRSYHSVIKYPMSLDAIEQNISSQTVKSVSEVVSSCLLIIQNARYYNEETSEIHECALNLQRTLIECMPCESPEVIVLSTKVMIDIADKLKANTEIACLTKVKTNSKFVNMSFDQFYVNVKSGFYTRLDRFQDDLLHIIISNMNVNQFNEAETKLLSIMKYYLTMRNNITVIKSRCFDLTMKKFVNHYQDRLNVTIPQCTTTCLTHNGCSYMVGEKVRVAFSDDDQMILHINVVNSPCWIAGTVYFELNDTLLKTDIKDIVHVKYIIEKLTKRYRYLSYNYRTRLASDIVTNKSEYCKQTFPSLFSCLTFSKYNNQTVINGSTESKTLYLQFVRENGDIFKVGDFVYLNSDKELPYIARIDKIHKDKKDLVWVYGPWFIRPMDTAFYESKAFYPNEVFMSNISDVNHINSIEGHCELLTSKDYAVKHPLSFLEKDVYICDHKYDESNHKFSKLSESKLYHNPAEQIDNLESKEWFHFSKPKSLYRTTKPDFQKPVQVDVDSSSDEERDTDESDNTKEIISEKTQVDQSILKNPCSNADESSASNFIAESTPVVKNVHPDESNPQKAVLNKYTPKKFVATSSDLQTPVISLTNSIKAVQQTLKHSAKNVQHYNFLSTQNQDLESHQNITSKVASFKKNCTRTLLLTCGWLSCRQTFTNSNEYYKHVINTQTHMNGSTNLQWKCYWNGCTNRIAKCEGMITQILLRRHLLSHMSDCGYTQVNHLNNSVSHPKILRHSETYKIFLNKLIQQKQSQKLNLVDTILD